MSVPDKRSHIKSGDIPSWFFEAVLPISPSPRLPVSPSPRLPVSPSPRLPVSPSRLFIHQRSQ
ncbi:MAG TPA: hypothetical protein IGS52_14215 [Oscillatoriaceae cyanobacterium M33_DOE_052]|uniref:Uncharacterized protein n=1 Tax=Planktothricoides sp. SpSt-374 TaxID=2282167 RepID=A0A7C3VN58_9CYAN|nr:hypothetical protein [Oscillatoriaceae cyanobacterium M33_DOE_052]